MTDLAPGTELAGMTGPPVGFSLNRGSALTQLTNKYAPGSPISQFLPSVNPIVARALANYDISRVNQGQSPLTKNQTRLAGTAANSINVDQSLPFISHVTSQGVTPEPERPWWQNAAADVQSIVASIPKFPVALAQEGAQLWNLPADYQTAMNKPTSNPFQTLGNLAQLPGVRLIPGAFTAAQYGTGGAGTSALAEHPVMSILDVLPYASKAASLTKTASAAGDVAQRAAAITGELPHEPGPITSVLKYGRPSGPVEGVMRQFGSVGDEIPTLVPNAPTRALQAVTGKVGGTGVGQFAQSAFGQRNRYLARIQNRTTADVEAAISNGYIAPGMDGPMVQASIDTLPAAQSLLNDFEAIAPARKAELISSLRDDTPVTLSTPEAKYLDTYKSAIDQYTDAQVASGELATIQYPHGPEVQLPGDAARILKARATAGQQAAVAHLRASLDPTTSYAMDPAAIHTDFTRAMADDSIPARVKKVLARGYVTALDQHGVDTAAARGVLASNPRAADLVGLPGTISPTTASAPAHVLTDLTAALEPLRSQSVTVNRFLTNLSRGELSAAYRDIDAISHQAGVQNLLSSRSMDVGDLRAAVTRQNQALKAQSLLDKAGFTDSATKLAARTSEALDARLVPARWRGPLQAQLQSDATDLINTKTAAGELTSAQQAAMLDRATHRAFADLATDLPELRAMRAEVRNSWQDLVARGDGPVFVHDVHPSRVAGSVYPKVTGAVTTPSQLKSRLWDAGGTTEDLGIALNHQAVEHLVLQGNKSFVDTFTPHLTRTLADIRDELVPQAQRAYTRNPAISFQAHMDNLVAREFAPFNPNDYLAGRTSTLGADPATQLMMPRDVLANLERLRAGPGQFERILSTPMNLFRSSVLPLSPRWHVNNILGGLITTTARAENPLTIWKYARRAWNMTKEGGLDELARNMTDPAEIEAARLAAPGGATRQMSEWFRDAPLETDAQKLSALHDYMAGSTLRRVWDEVKAKGASGIQKSYDFNQHFDDFYRNMAYLEGHGNALSKSMTSAEAIRAGVGQMRKMLQSWDTLTPIERSVMRSIFPFYSWTRFMMKYVLTYPGDHPWRTSILANLANAETADLGSGLPQDLQSLLFLGGMDSDGNIKAVNTGGFNPFRDVGNYFTLGGFLAGGDGNVAALTSQVNPVISTLLQWAGVDPSQGVAELYPELKYDPATGHLIAAPKENPLLGALGNFVPQTRAITAFAGINSQYRDLAANDPAAAGRYLASTVGVPVLGRSVNLPQKAFGTELTKYRALTSDLSSSLAGNDMGGFAARYPGLRAFADRIATLEQDQAFQQRYGIQPGLSGSQQPSVTDVLAQIGKTAVPVG